jgi:hypothetical protein
MDDQRREHGQKLKILVAEWVADLWENGFDRISDTADAKGGKVSIAFEVDVEFGQQSNCEVALVFQKVDKYRDSRSGVVGDPPDPDPDQVKMALEVTEAEQLARNGDQIGGAIVAMHDGLGDAAAPEPNGEPEPSRRGRRKAKAAPEAAPHEA